mgnify:CR=1 FL=1
MRIAGENYIKHQTVKHLTILLIFIISLNFISWLFTSNQFSIDAAVFDAPLLPENDNQYNLGYVGIPNQRWQNGFFSNNLTTIGNISIGTTTITEKLNVNNGNISQTSASLVLVGSANIATSSIMNIYVSGRYAYMVGTNVAGSSCPDQCEFKIYDISNPNVPALVGSANLGASGQSVYVSGRYAYITQNAVSGNDFKIYDISNPSAPALVSGADLGIGGNSVYVSGRYAYVGSDNIAGNSCPAECEFKIYDISDSNAPALIGSSNIATGSAGDIQNIHVSGRYAYIVGTNVTGSSCPDQCEFKIYDISNPNVPALIGSANLGNAGFNIYISGRYAYITQNAVSGNDFKIYDISNPSAPALVSGADLGNIGRGIYVSGRYAYMTNDDILGNDFKIYDISNPSAPALVSGADLGIGGNSVYVSGRYAYVGSDNIAGNSCPAECEFKIYDISGLETTSANIHSLEAGNLQVRNDIIAQGQLQISGGMNVGTGGIFSNGPIGVSIASTTQTNAVSAYFQGRVGIATTTPTQKLEVNGGIRLYGNSESTCDATSGPSTRGTLQFTQGSSGVADTLEICNSSSTDGYVWKKLY